MQFNLEKTIDSGVKKSIFKIFLLKILLGFPVFFILLFLREFNFDFLSDAFLIYVVLFVYFTFELFLFYYYAQLKKFFYILKEDRIEAFFKEKNGKIIKGEIFYKDVRFCKVEKIDRKYSTLYISIEEKWNHFFSQGLFSNDGKVVSLQGNHIYPYFGFRKKRIVIPFVPTNEAEEFRNYILLKGGQDLKINKKDANDFLYKKIF